VEDVARSADPLSTRLIERQLITRMPTRPVIRRRRRRVVTRKRSPPAGLPNPTQEETTIVGLDNPIHIAFLLILLLLVFGAKRLPEMGRSLGDGMRGFKDAISGESSHAAARPAAREVAQPTLVAQQHEPATVPSEIRNASADTAEKLTA
jgi:sec-independent protein translocase protein TatA